MISSARLNTYATKNNQSTARLWEASFLFFWYSVCWSFSRIKWSIHLIWCLSPQQLASRFSTIRLLLRLVQKEKNEDLLCSECRYGTTISIKESDTLTLTWWIWNFFMVMLPMEVSSTGFSLAHLTTGEVIP